MVVSDWLTLVADLYGTILVGGPLQTQFDDFVILAVVFFALLSRSIGFQIFGNLKELPKGDFLIISDSVQDIIILQSESKMKAALGKNVKVSLPKAFQTSKVQTKSLAIKGVPTNITEFTEFLD